MKKRVWELDALRGICILGMVAVHFVYDMTALYGLADWDLPLWFHIVQDWGGVVFLLISGICVTLGSRSVRRGGIVFACGMLCTLVTYGMAALGLAGKDLVIYFGVLHCLGVCMLLWPVFRRLPWPVLLGLGLALSGLGLWLRGQPPAAVSWLIPLGWIPAGFVSSDYFPLLPNLGFFLLGSVLGRTLYAKKETRLPRVNAQGAVIRFFCRCGQHSLWIYLLHQPVLSLLLWLGQSLF
ncbi:MAG TPA: DUF1624 domain-containing protein [Candidatus Faecousia intestinigallinarum]|nr:DUF1624 domain-containing protein [Candidatus Faecousia intestinigallinarum]